MIVRLETGPVFEREIQPVRQTEQRLFIMKPIDLFPLIEHRIGWFDPILAGSICAFEVVVVSDQVFVMHDFEHRVFRVLKRPLSVCLNEFTVFDGLRRVRSHWHEKNEQHT